ncbi:MAG TPA: HEPN domain-containing protein [Candidatus Binataceae bacterium]|nr:HEPN domain-containing protein [Candidatus Binataceae bacterium]
MQLDDVAVKAELSAQTSGDAFHERQILQHAWLTLTPDKETHFESILTAPLASLHQLMCLALGRRVPCVRLDVQTPRTAVMNIAGGRPFLPASKIFFSQKRVLPLPDREHPMSFLFTLTGAGDLRKSVSQWHLGFNAFRSSLDFYFSLDTESDSNVATEHHFLSSINAFESYHRAVGKKQFDLPEADHQLRLVQALERTPPEHREWLKAKLEYSNEVSMRSRLKQLYDEQPDSVARLLGNKSQFVGTIINTRNYLIHHSPALESAALTGLPLWLATRKLRLAIQICFLRQMGLSDDAISEMIPRSRDYRVLRFYS